MQFTGKTYWLIGASAGIGRALAQALNAQGVTLILSARDGDKLNALCAQLSPDCRALPFDVTSAEAVTQALGQLGEIDGIIYMAGDYEPMSAQNWDVAIAQKVADVNYMAAQRILGHIIPQFAARGAGHVVITGSLAGFSGLQGAIGYGSSKAALMHLAQNIHADLRGTGVRVQLINPGFVKTRLTQKNDFKMPFITTPERAADRIIKHMRSRRFSRSFPALFAWVFKLRAIWYVIRG